MSQKALKIRLLVNLARVKNWSAIKLRNKNKSLRRRNRSKNMNQRNNLKLKRKLNQPN